jgi:phage terminase large subunit GpA-like protein
MDGFDAYWTREQALCWATRLGKTFFGQTIIEYTADQDPAPMMLCSSAEKLAFEICERTQEMLRRSRHLRALLLKSRYFQRRDSIELKNCRMFLAWARSPMTLADKNLKVGVANELDQWEHRAANEADPMKLFSDRFKDCWSTRKIVWDSVPRLKAKSRIEPKLLAGTNCSYWVPCPSCRRYQILEEGDQTAHGLRWETVVGRNEVELARRTAYYCCRHCEAKITDYQRSWMLRRGVWCPHGARLNDEVALEITEAMLAEGEATWDWKGWSDCDWIEGTPSVNGPLESYHLSSLYALSLDWGDIAAEYVETIDQPQLRRNYENQWMARTWSGLKQQQTWQQLGERLKSDIPQRNVPSPLSLVTIGIDKQADHYPYVVIAWGPGRRSHTLEYGSCGDLDQLEELLNSKWPHVDGGPAVKCSLALIDCGYRSGEVYQFCRDARKEKIPILPCRGSDRPLNAFYIKRKLSDKSSAPGQPVVWIDSAATQDWLDHRLYQLQSGDEGAKTIFRASLASHQDYLEQLLNDAPATGLDRRQNLVETWQRIDVDIANDYRDATRYALVAMLVATRNAPIKPRTLEPPPKEKPEPPPKAPARPRLHDGPRPQLF